MEVVLDGETQQLDLSDCANLSELVATVYGQVPRDEPQVVVGVEVDGVALDPDRLAALEEEPLDDVERVVLTRRPMRDVAVSVLLQGSDYCGQIGPAIEQSVGHFRAGRSDHGSEVLAAISDSLTILTGILQSATHALPEWNDSFAKLQASLYPWLESLVEAQTDADPLRIADLLEYEIAPRIEEWRAVMRSVARGPESDAQPVSS